MSKSWIKVVSNIALPVTALSSLGVVLQSSTAQATQDGTFTGDSFSHQFGSVQLEVIIQKGRILQVRDLKATESNLKNSRWISMAEPILTQQTLVAQSAKISGVSGASYTSVGWQKSLASALSKADFTSSVSTSSTAKVDKSPTPVITQSTDVSAQKIFTTIAGTNCPMAGRTVVVSDKKFTCTKIGKKLYWDKGKPVPLVKSNSSKLSLDSDFKFMSDLLPLLKANGFDCGNYVKDPEPGLGTREGGTCNWNGKDVTVTVFAGSNSQVKELENAFKGLSQGYIMLRSNWAFSIEDPETARTLSSLLNMEIL